MIPTRVLHDSYERLVGTAAIDLRLRTALLRSPGRTAREFGISDEDTRLVENIQVEDLRAFARVLCERLYGADYATHYRHRYVDASNADPDAPSSPDSL